MRRTGQWAEVCGGGGSTCPQTSRESAGSKVKQTHAFVGAGDWYKYPSELWCCLFSRLCCLRPRTSVSMVSLWPITLSLHLGVTHWQSHQRCRQMLIPYLALKGALVPGLRGARLSWVPHGLTGCTACPSSSQDTHHVTTQSPEASDMNETREGMHSCRLSSTGKASKASSRHWSPWA